MTTIKVFDWPCQMRFRRADVGYVHASVAGTSYFPGRPQGETLALPKRMMIEASGPEQWKGVVEVIRYSLQPNNLIRMPDPTWAKGRSTAAAALGIGVVWEAGADWTSGAAWGPYIGLAGGHVEGDTTVSLMNLPPNEPVFRAGDVIGIGGRHCMVKWAEPSDAAGLATVRLVRPLEAPAQDESQVEFPVMHLFQASIPIPTDRDLALVYDWSATMTETFKPEFSGVTFETASFFE